MAESASPSTFSCAACGKMYAWRAELAGRQARCPCGQVLTVPSRPPSEPPEDSYDLADEPAPKAAPVRPTPPAQPVAPSRPAPVVAYASTHPSERASSAITIEGSPFKDFYLPIALIVLGTALTFLLAKVMTRGRADMGHIGVYVAVRLIVDLVLILISLFVAARLMSLGFGALWQAIIKICAIAISPQAIGGLLSYLVGDKTGMLGWFVALVLYYALFMVLFDLDFQETMICAAIIWVIRTWVGYFIVAMMLSRMF